MLKTYRGSCHCGAVKFEADLDLAQPTFRCNCSICRRNRFWPAVAREGGLRIPGGRHRDADGQDVRREPYVDGMHDRWQSAPGHTKHL